MKNLSILDKLLYFINSILATLLLLSYFLPYISPQTIPIFAVLSLFVPFLLVLNLLCIIYWIVKLKKQFLLSSLVLAIGFFFSSPFYKISESTSSLNNDLKVMSYNVKTFDFFTQKEIHEETKNGYKFIANKDPDVLVIQEFYNSSKLNLNFPYKYVKLRTKNKKIGMAIFSKYKIINSGSLDLKNTNNNIIYVDIERNKDTIRIYNLHLQSLSIKPNEENFGESNSEKLLKRVSSAFAIQASQTEKFLAHEKDWKGKKIVCGDFNNTAYSWVYNQISDGKKDAFEEAGKGFGKTFNYFFPMRIDFILTDETAIINQFKTFSEKYSDHYPILSRINW